MLLQTKRNLFQLNTLKAIEWDSSRWPLIQKKVGLSEQLLGCLQYFVCFLIKQEAPPVRFISTQAAALVASY